MRSLTRAALGLCVAVSAITVTHGQQPVQDPQAPGRLQNTPAPPPAPPTGEISGRVTGAGAPVALARVVLSADEIFSCPPNNPPADTANCPRYNRVAQTDADGRYVIGNLPVGKTFVITVSKTGFVTKAFGQTSASAPAPIALAAAEKRPNVDIALARGTVITGVLHGEDGQPFGGALIEAYRAVLEDGRRTLASVGEAVTDDLGRFRVIGLAPGQYYLSASDPAFATAGDAGSLLQFPPTFYPGTTRQEDAKPLTVEAEKPLEGVTLSLIVGDPIREGVQRDADDPGHRPAPARHDDRAAAGQKPKKGTPPAAAPEPPPTAALAGTIVSVNSGKPIAQSRVTVASDVLFHCPAGTPPGQTFDCPRYTRVARTDAAGRFSIPDLPRGATFVVTASRTGYAARAFGETPPEVPPSYVELKAGEKRDNVNVALVEQNTISGTLLDQDGTPFAGAVVEAQRATYTDNKRRFVSIAEAISDERGQFRIFGLSPGKYYVTAFDPAYARVGDQFGQLFYGPTFYPGTVYQDDAVPVVLDPGHPVDGLRFGLKIVRPARISGKITAGGAMLLAGAVNIGPLRNSKSASFAVSEADIRPDGIFQFANILAERYKIRARGEVERQGKSYFQQYSQPVEGEDIAGIDLTLSPGAVVNGRVDWDGKSTAPPADKSSIRVRAPMIDGSLFGDALTGTIASDHTFSLRGVMAGEHFIRLEGLPEPWRLKQVLLGGTDVTDIPIPMDYNQVIDGLDVILTDVFTTVTGAVTVAAGDVPQAYGVIVFPTLSMNWTPGSRYVRIAHVDDRGLFSIRGLPPGQYFAAVSRDFDESDITNDRVLDQLSKTATTFRLGEGDRRRLSLTGRIPARGVRK